MFSRLLSCLAIAAVLTLPGAGLPAEDLAKIKEQREEALAAIRAAAAGRDIPEMKKILAEAAKLKGDEKFDAELARLDELGEYLEKFYEAVTKGAKSLQGLDELMVGDQLVAVVEFENNKLVLRVAGQNREYTPKTVPPKIALTLAEQVLRPDAPQNKVFFGTFLLMDAKGDAGLARKMWDEAAKGGVDVKRLLPELDADRPGPPIEIPPLTVAMKNLLAEKNWSLRVQGEKGWVRQPLDKIAQQNEEGRLVIRVPADTKGEVQIVNKRQLAGDFGIRIILQGAKKGQTIGLVSAESQDAGYVATLPSGTVLVEFGRQAGEFKCRLNGQERDVESRGKGAPRMAGLLGISITPGEELTIAALEFIGR